MHRLPAFALVLVLSLSASHLISAEPAPNAGKPYTPKIAGPSNEAERALKHIRVPQGLRVDLFAAEPLLANPVCFCVDEHNRFYVAETFRLHAGVTDIRGHMNWLDDDLASRTHEDLIAMLRRHLGNKIQKDVVEHERIRLLEDTRGTGKADRSMVFAEGFHHIGEGLAAGLLTRPGKLWYTCIPDLWQFERNDKGEASARKALHHGYGVHNGFIGHDVHGLRMGPDGKLYFSSGDRGFNIRTEGRTVASVDSGAVLRCNPDGSALEVVATGLRNPQELAFDQYGNLFTGDNNADGGDKARWVYVVEGGDSGWRVGYQYMHNPVALGPWNAEKLWHPQHPGQAAYLVPPVANVADGPAGLTYYPGVGLPERYREHFFLVDFRGGSGQSGIRSFAVKPNGATFEMVDQHQCIWSVLATDVDFGMDCNLYLTDWVEGWDKPNKGRIYKVSDPTRQNDPVVQSVKKLMAEGMDHRPLAELAKLLEHPDMRVRLEAQFALADKASPETTALLAGIAKHSGNPLARLHAIWGLGQRGRREPANYEPVMTMLSDRDSEVRTQAAKIIGDGRLPGAYDKLLPLLKDRNARVRFFATLGLGKLGRKEAMTPIVQMLRENADRDTYLRHAGVMALTWLHDRQELLSCAEDSSAAVRMAVLLTWRRLGNPDIARFLSDAEPRLVVEAARAIYDAPIYTALPQLAALIQRRGLSEPLLYRVLNAHFRLGKAENANAVAAFAARADVPEALRLEALRELADWTHPSGRDRIVGLWRPVEPRAAHLAVDALRPALGGILSGPDPVRQEGARLAAKLGIKDVGPLLYEMVADAKRPVAVRTEALKGLAVLKDERLPQAIELALATSEPRLRTEGRRALAKAQPEAALAALKTVLNQDSVSERQGAFSILAEMNQAVADQLLARWMDKLLAREVTPEVQLDLLEAAARRATPELKDKLSKYEAARSRGDGLAAYRETLVGGDAEAGRQIFLQKAEVSCVRCHKVKGDGGEVGPDLAGIGNRQKREYLLESIVNPNKEIAKGFETAVLALTSGQFVVGIVKTEDAKEVRLMTAEGKLLTVAKKDIEERSRGKSAMPEDLIKYLSKVELRDLVEFLASLK